MQEKNTYIQIEEVKNKIIDLSLIFAIFIGFAAYFLSLTRYSETGFEISFVTDLIVLLVTLAITIFRRKLNLKLKSYVVIGAISVLILVDIVQRGVLGADKVLIILIPFFSVLAFSLKRTIGIFILMIIGFFTIAYFHLTGYLTIPSQDDIRLSTWIINILLIIIVTIVVLIVQNKFNFTYIKLLSDLEQTNKTISEKERNYREIFNSSTDAIFIHDLSGKILDVNDSMLKMYGYEKSDISNIDIAELISELLNTTCPQKSDEGVENLLL